MTQAKHSRPKGVIVTGGAEGIGRAIAEAFAEDGANVRIFDMNETALRRAVDARSSFSGAALDVSDAVAVAEAFSRLEAWGPLDVLVNNVGAPGPVTPIEQLSVDDWDRQISINLSGAFYCAREAAQVMKRRKGGVIINISTASVISKPSQRAGYVVSKAALEELTILLAKELGPYGVRAHAVRPGLVDSPRMDRLLADEAAKQGVSADDLRREVLDTIWMRSSVEMADVARACLFLASAAADKMTGQIISVDAGVQWEP